MSRRSGALPIAAALLLTVRCRSPEGTVRGDVYDFSVTPATVQLARHDTIRLHTTVVNMDNEVLTGVPVTYTSDNGDATAKAIHLWSLPGDSEVATVSLVAAARAWASLQMGSTWRPRRVSC
jgi:hypothetical protein